MKLNVLEKARPVGRPPKNMCDGRHISETRRMTSHPHKTKALPVSRPEKLDGDRLEEEERSETARPTTSALRGGKEK